jgi:hypothetical protein
MEKILKIILAITLSLAMVVECFSGMNLEANAADIVESTELRGPLAFILEHTNFDSHYISGSIYAADGQEDCTYTIFVDGEIFAENLEAGDFLVDGIQGGNHTVSCRTFKDGVYSTVTDDMIKNICIQESFYLEASSDTTAFEDSCDEGLNYIWRNGTLLPKVVASAATEDEQFPARNSIDGKMDTSWQSKEKENQWILIDLGKVKPIRSVCILWGDASAEDYMIQTSKDGKSFRTAAYVTDARSWGQNDKRDTVIIDNDVEGRFVKLIPKLGYSTTYYEIYEVAVYGSDDSVDIEPGTEETSEENTTEEISTEENTTEESSTVEITTDETTTSEESTSEESTGEISTGEETSNEITSGEMTTNESTTAEITTKEETRAEVTTVEKTTATKPTVAIPVKIGQASIKKVEKKKKSAKTIKVILNKTNDAAGYQVAVYNDKKTAKKNKKAIITKIVKKLKFEIVSKKLKNKKDLYVRVRAYKLNGKKKVYGSWSALKKT